MAANRPRPARTDVCIVFGGFRSSNESQRGIAHAVTAMGFEVLVLSDRGRDLYLDGARGFPSAQLLGERIAEARAAHSRMVCMGFSGGGFAALRYGIEHGADHIIGHNAYTTFDLEARNMAISQPNLVKVAERLDEFEPDDKRRNIRHFLEGSDYAGRIVLHYAALRPVDAYMALNLADDPRVTAVPRMSRTHPFNDVEAQVPILLGDIAPEPLAKGAR